MENVYKYRNNYTKNNYARLTVIVPKSDKDKIMEHIKNKGFSSTSDYFRSLLYKDMEEYTCNKQEKDPH